jgi:hypothetical protein
MGLGKDTNTTPGQFSDLAWSFYLSYLVCEPLAGYLLQKLPVAKFLGVNGRAAAALFLGRTDMGGHSYSVGCLPCTQQHLQGLRLPSDTSGSAWCFRVLRLS